MTTSVTQQLAEWIAEVRYDDVPEVAARRVEERFVDSLGVQLAGMSVATGEILSRYVRGFVGDTREFRRGCGVQDHRRLRDVGERDDRARTGVRRISAFSGHYANPMTAATLAVGEKLGVSGQDLIVAWLVGGYEVIWRTAKPTMDLKGPRLLQTGWFNQGFQPVMGVAAATAKLMGLDVTQIRMAIGHAASAMGGVQKNRASDTKGFTAGNAAMHGVMAAELVGMGFTANQDILDGDDGVMRMIGGEVGDPQKVIEDLGTWDMATRVDSAPDRLLRCGALEHGGHGEKILEQRPVGSGEIDSIDVELPRLPRAEQAVPLAPDGPGGQVQRRVRHGRYGPGRAGRRSISTPMPPCSGPRHRNS